MKGALLLLISNIPAIILLCIAGFMVYRGIHNYGWVILAAICVVHSITIDEKQ